MLERRNYKDYKDRPLLITPDSIQDILLKYGAVRMSDASSNTLMAKKSMNLKMINIIDPTFSKNNLGKSISRLNSIRLRQAMILMKARIEKIYQKANSLAQAGEGKECEFLMKFLLETFKYTFESNGIHPSISVYLPQIGIKDDGDPDDETV